MKDRFATAQPWLSVLARLVLVVVWMWAGWPKLLDSQGAILSVRAFKLLPEAAVRPFGYGLPLVELALGLFLLIGLGTRWAALATAGMMAMFLFGITMAWARGLSIDCGCFGNTGTVVKDPVPGYIRDLFRDTGFLLLAAFLVRWPFSRFSLDQMLGFTEPAPVASQAA